MPRSHSLTPPSETFPSPPYLGQMQPLDAPPLGVSTIPNRLALFSTTLKDKHAQCRIFHGRHGVFVRVHVPGMAPKWFFSGDPVQEDVI